MRRQIQTLSLAIAIAAAATTAVAQTNPLSRGASAQHDSFYYSAIKSENTISSPLGSTMNQVTRPGPNFGPVTPVPEPSEWAMLLAGLALVGFIVRRNAKRP
ncbi:MAG TPA: PEPxxWA-CTERM sorting domain-containing protein [Usitatibacter sp.]|nr:PEPxxWA-CTERM sorting domain-containing protein [Usitatibacter sp.]